MRKALWLAAGILVVGGASIAVILLSDGGYRFEWPELPGISADRAQRPLPAPMVPPLAAVPDAPNRFGPAQATVFEPPPPKPEAGTWAAVRLATRAAGLGASGAAVSEYLADLQSQITDCFDEETQSRHGRSAVSRAPTDQEDSHEGPTVLTLHLESGAGGVRIIDAPCTLQGPASDGLIACAQGVLRGKFIPVDGVTKPGRSRLVFPVVP